MDFSHFYETPAYAFDKFNPSEPRVPSGPEAGEWTSGGGGAGGGKPEPKTTHQDRLDQIEHRVDELSGQLEKNRDDPKAKAEMQSLMAEHESIINSKIHGSPKFKTASELYKSTFKAGVTPEAIIASRPNAQEKINAVRKRLETAIPTDAPVEKGGFKLPNGQYTPERGKVHNDIIDKIFTDDAVRRARPPAGERPTVVFLGGRGGSGKTWFTKNGPVDRTKAIYLNSDDIKEAMPEWKGWNAAQVHEEATDILNQVIDAARNAGLNVIIDATMKSDGTIGRYVSDFREAGYKTEGYYMHTPPHEAAARALDRFLRGEEKGQGRYVPLELILNSTTNEGVFDRLSKFMNKWAIYDNSDAQGGTPKYVNSGENPDV